ncbi:MAG TPA: TetR/AcrR family transcriptional regulator [Candidatus Binataceae bacterium]|nr:TetR/AcrR family transcriptional regulator [Candidatus Binataceae bacterium]
MSTRLRLKGAPRARKPRGSGHERRGEILTAARQMFLKEGYENFTTRKLAARVGLSQTGLYVYFRSKDEILDAVCHATFDGLAEQFRAVAQGLDASPRHLRQLIEAYIDFGLAHPDEYQLTFMAGRGAPKFTHRKNPKLPLEVQGIGMKSFLLLRDAVARMIAAGSLKDGEMTVIAQTIWTAAHGLVSLMIARPGYLLSERRALIDALVDTLLTGLQGSNLSIRKHS